MTASPYARPVQRRAPMTTGLVGALNRDWQHLAATPTPRHWDQRLRQHRTVGQLLAAISRLGNPALADPLLHALLRHHADGDQLAGRALLQTMLGKVTRMTNTARARGVPDPGSAAMEAMWTAIRAYPLHRTTSVAGNLALNALKALQRPEDLTEIPLPHPDLDAASSCTVQISADAAEEGDPNGDQLADPQHRVAQTLAWALEHRILSPVDVRILTLVYIDPPAATTAWRHDELCRRGRHGGEDLHTIADTLGMTHAALRQRHCRAIRALIDAIAGRLANPAA